ncbi:MAG: UDP-N-acetylglucosamine 2-epimerase [Ignavibacteriaceae bacterium]
MKKRNVCIVTGARSEYGLLKPLIDELNSNQNITLNLVVTGMHLSPEFGLTVKEIENDKLKIHDKIEILLSSDTHVGISKSIGLAVISFSEVFEKMKPDILIGLGDRFELFAAVSAAFIAGIPIAHISGGEVTIGAFDDGLRHSITKMSHLHFTSTEKYRKRVIQLGEDPKRVFNVGSLSVDNIKKMKLMSKKELEASLNFKLDQPTFIVTFHPATLSDYSSERQFGELLKVLDFFKDFKVIFTKPNADNGGRIIINMIDEYVNENKGRSISFISLGHVRYLSLLNQVEMMIGNSSSGIVEMPYFNKPTINIGDRQQGRIFGKSIIQCEPKKGSIIKAIEIGISNSFRNKVRINNKPYGDGIASKKISKIITDYNLDNIIKKIFYDINFKIDKA